MTAPVRRGAQAVADAANGLDERVMAGRRERLAQSANVDVDRPLFDEYVIAPDLVEELAAAEDPGRVRHEEVQKAEFRRPELDGAASSAYVACCRIEP